MSKSNYTNILYNSFFSENRRQFITNLFVIIEYKEKLTIRNRCLYLNEPYSCLGQYSNKIGLFYLNIENIGLNYDNSFIYE